MNCLRFFCAAVVAIAVAGCAETRGTRVAIDTETGDAVVREDSIRLANRVAVDKVTYSEVSEGISRASVTIRSLTKRRQRLQAQMVWMDAEGTEIDAEAKPYRAIVLDGNDTTVFTGLAPNSRAVKAKLKIREIETVE